MLRSPAARRALARVGVALAAMLVTLPWARPAEAGFIGDPTLTVGAGRFALSGEFDFVTDRDLDFEGGGHADLENFRFLASGTYGFAPNVDGFLKLGAFSGEIEDVDIDTSLAVGGGLKGVFVDRGDIRLGALGQVMYFSSEIDVTDQDIDWLEFDLALAVSFRGLGQIVPYGGVKLSIIDGEIEGAPDFEQDDLIGIFGGVSVVLSPQVLLGAELRLIDETAIGFVARFLF